MSPKTNPLTGQRLNDPQKIDSQSQEKYNVFIAGIKEYAIFFINTEGLVEFWNEGAKSLNGYTEEEIIGQHFSIFYPKEEIEKDIPNYELKQAKKKGKFEEDGWRVRKDGTSFYANIVITPVCNKEKKIIGFSIILKDLTEKKEAEEKLVKSEEKYRLLVEGVSEYAIFMLDPDGNVASWNEGAKKFKGYSEQEIIGKHFSIFYPQKKIDSGYPEFELEQAKKKGKFEDDGWRVRKDGTAFYANIVITALFNKEKELIGFSKITKDLTARKESEEMLRKSEEKYRLLIEGVKDYAIFMLDPNGIVATWNEGAKRLKKYEEHEIIGKHFSIFYPEEAKAKGFPDFELEQAIKRGRFEDEGWRVRKDGSLFFVNVIITPIYNKAKCLLGFSKISRDLTEKRQAEEELRNSEQKYRFLVEGVKDYAIFMLDAEGYIQSWNEGAKRLKGYSEREIIGKHFSNFYPKETRESGFPAFELEQAKKVGRFEDEGWRVRKDGTTFFANVVITAVFNTEKKLIGFSKITRDLSERKESEELLKKSEERFRLLIEGVKEYAIFMVDPNGYVISWNEGAKRLKKYEEREILGKHFSIFYPEEKRRLEYPKYELEQARKNGKFEDEGLRVRKDGSTFYANVVITAVYNNKNELIGFSKITRDLTERKKAEDEMTRLNTELEERVQKRTEELSRTVAELKKINADLDNFIYTASHDLKAPVSNIEGLMYALNKSLKNYNYCNDEIDSLLTMINKSVQRFQTTIKDLTAVNESQRSDRTDIVNIDLSDVIDDVISSIDHLVKESQAQIEVDTEISRTFKFSKVHIRSIIYNFLSNSIKYRSPKRPLAIEIKSYNEGDFYVIQITDNGIGIKEENIEKAFQMFKRLHNHVEGSGVGLYIVRRIVENAGGKIEVTSQVDKGTTFKVSLPDRGNDKR